MLSARGSQIRRPCYDDRNFHKSSLDSSVNIVTRLQADNPGSIPARGKERASSLTGAHRPLGLAQPGVIFRSTAEESRVTVGGTTPLLHGLHRDNSDSFRCNMCLN